jgi:hypothetical protein
LWTDFKVDLLDLDTFKIDANKTKCFLYNELGNFVKEFNSIYECAMFLQVDVSNVSRAIRGKYLINNLWYCSDTKKTTFEVPKSRNHKNDPVFQYDM